MKKAAFAIVLTLAGLSASAFAQANFVFHADVPFAFSVDGHQYSAGNYDLMAKNANWAILRNRGTGESGLIPLISPQLTKTATPHLRFSKAGDKAILLMVTDADGQSWRVPVSRKEKDEARNPESKTIAVAMR